MSLNIKPKLALAAKARCRELRKRQTQVEKIFWERVRNRQFQGLKFCRQYPLFYDLLGREAFYIADFYCHEKRLVVELDGGIHEKKKEEDRLRDEVINSLGLKVVRFKNEDVLGDIEEVLKQIQSVL